MNKANLNPKVDAYIAKAAPFAQPVLTHLRELIHKACPDVVEEMKWSRPFFLHGGVILCNLSAFKEHCSFGFWGAEIGKALRQDGVVQDGGMGSLGRITSPKDLPSDKAMLAYLRQAAAFIDEGKGETVMAVNRRVVKAPKIAVETPAEFAAALKKNKAAGKVFEAFSPSCKREYVEWIADAKREETRTKRITQAVEWIAEGKQRNWKYQDC
ncbi:MAG: YdeI/OmpD-associated family protein [Acidobacteriota bacterium]|nr:YdeI/OmpD-associated family protein [Acidobacteriota bacterium]